MNTYEFLLVFSNLVVFLIAIMIALHIDHETRKKHDVSIAILFMIFIMGWNMVIAYLAENLGDPKKLLEYEHERVVYLEQEASRIQKNLNQAKAQYKEDTVSFSPILKTGVPDANFHIPGKQDSGGN